MSDLTEISEPVSATAVAEPAGLPDFPMTRSGCPFSPPPEYARMRAETPIRKVRLRWSGKEVWVLTKHEHVKRILGDPTLSSSWKKPNYPLQVPVADEIIQYIDMPIVAQDPPEHGVTRRLLIPELTVKRMAALRGRMQELVDEHLDAMLAAQGPVDLVQALAYAVPSLMFCELIGVPASDTGYFREYAELNVKSDIDPDEIMIATAQMDEYLDDLITEKETNPKDDLLSRVISKNNESDEPLDRDAMVGLAKFLLFGGFDTTANMISLGTMLLLERPDQLAELRADPSLWPAAIEELIRYLAIADSSPARTVPEDIELDGVLIRAGDGVISLTGAACRDPEAFDDPDTLDIHRDARGHSAFGHGPHQCPGANLVRFELEIVFRSLFERIPNLRMAVPLSQITFKSGTLVHGVIGEIPVLTH